ncbi:TFIIH/NER complex subunit [Saccharomycopsis crataegensis]|uniref:General transcription and DNA repair factor IIH n=1 Tax=Saccharomycopsis crataegensis TaxID=43959 RepID=A0AAV5QND7_9ASCO|nr:TFIIH/NER complex subunit [Saccharomycopsis crataegensis]
MDSDEDEYVAKNPTSKNAGKSGMAKRTRKHGDDDVMMLLEDSEEDPGEADEDEGEGEEDDDDDGEYYGRKTKKKPGRGNQKKKKTKVRIDDNLKGKDGGYAWEDKIKRSWDIVKEDKDGSLEGLVSGLLEANKMKKIYKNVTPFQRGIIRSLILVIDCSRAMSEKDLRPNRYSLTIQYALEFVTEFFDQNPISQLGILGMQNGLSMVISDLSGNPIDHINNLKQLKKKDPEGDPSIQNALEMSRGMLLHTSPHSTKEVLIIFGTLFTSDPGDIFKTIDHLVNEKIRVRIIGLNAQVSICSKIVKETNYGDEKSNYGVILNEQHFKELLNDCITPLPVIKKLSSEAEGVQTTPQQKTFSLIKMGFPKRITEVDPSFCSCHSNLNYGGYICPFCKAKICSLPAVCPTCNLMLISSSHLARSYHHLFPLKNFEEVKFNEVDKSINLESQEPFKANFQYHQCYGCLMEFPVKSGSIVDPKLMKTTSRYQCLDCHKQFCIDCNVFIHEHLHNCPGCESNV